MRTIQLQKSPASAVLAAVLVGLLMPIIAFAVIAIVAPFRDPVVSWHNLWLSIWDYGLAAHCGKGPRGLFNFTCRFANIRQWWTYQPFLLRFYLWVFCVSCPALLAAIWTYSSASKFESVQTTRGAWPRYEKRARASLRQAIRETGGADTACLWLAPHVQLTPAAEAYNILLLGDHGSGKSGVIRGWSEQVLARNGRCILHDAKGELLASVPAPNVLLVAAHDARSWIWDIGRDVTNVHGARELAAKLVAQEGTNETMWSDGARALLAGAVEVLQVERGTDWGWKDLYEVVFQSPADLHAALETAQAPAARLIEFDSEGGATKTTLSLLLTLWVAALTTLRPLAHVSTSAEAPHFCVRDWLGEASTLPPTLIVQHSSDYPLLSAALAGLLVDVVAAQLLSPASPRRSRPWLHLILDELPLLGRLENFPKLLNVGREKGVQAIAATQDWQQIEKIYGPKDAATLEARFKIKVVTGLGISETRDHVVAHYGGKRAIAKWDNDGKGGRVLREVEIDVVEARQLTSELGVRKLNGVLHVRVVIFGLGDPAFVDIPFTNWAPRRDAHIPAEWA